METADVPPSASRPAGQEPSDGRAPRRAVRGRRGYFLPGIMALVALVVIGLLWGAGDLEHPAATSLTGSDVASQISLGIQTQEGSDRPPAVSCPRREPVRVGHSFDCRVAGSPPRIVHVSEIDGRGELRWSLASAG